MKGHCFKGLLLSLTLMVLIVGAGLAQGLDLTEVPIDTGENLVSTYYAPWIIKTLDSTGDVGSYASVTVDPDSGITYVSYYDATNKDLRMAEYVGSGGNCGSNNNWSCETIDFNGDVGQYSSISISPFEGEPGIAYYDSTNGALKYAYRDCDPSCNWIISTIDVGVPAAFRFKGLYTSLTYDSGSKPYIAYHYSRLFSDESLMVAYSRPNGNCGVDSAANQWQCDTIDSGDGVGMYTSIDIDSDDKPHIAYYDRGKIGLKYARLGGVDTNCGPGNAWSCRVIDGSDYGMYASLYVDQSAGDLPHIAYYDKTNGKLKYAYYSLSDGNCGINLGTFKNEWRCETIDDMGTSTHPMGVSLAVDEAGYPFIAYQNSAGSGTIKVARPVAALNLLVGNCGPTPSLFFSWQCETIPDFGISVRQGDYLSLDVSPSGLATIAYYGSIGASGGNLKIAYQRLQIFLPLIKR